MRRNWYYAAACIKEFNRALKKWAYAAAYGNAEAFKIEDDFYSMYDMGGEL